jgi:hypothetical protein
MKQKVCLIVILVAYAAVLSAQITREEADAVVWEHLQNECLQHGALYANLNLPSAEGIAITTSNDETFEAKYACWAYYLDISEQSQCRYFFVKADIGVLLEVIAYKDAGQSDLTQWEAVENVGIVGARHALPLRVYPNPVNSELRITNYEGGEIQIFSITGQNVGAYPCGRPVETGAGASPARTIDISHLATGVYFLKIENKVYKIIKK